MDLIFRMMTELPVIYMSFDEDKGRNSQSEIYSNNEPENTLPSASYDREVISDN